MIKLLLLPEILSEAINDKSSQASELLEKCEKEFDVQAWILASSVQKLTEQGVSAEQIQSVLNGISQIPVNARLNQEAFQSPHGFEMGMHLAAAKLFKIDSLVAEKTQPDSEGISVLTCQQVLELDQTVEPEKVDFLNLNLALHPIFDRVDGWHMEIIQNTAFAGGNHVAAFEKEFAEYCEAKHAVGVSNGTDALLFALLAMGISPGDEVITVPNTFIATTEAISQAGAKPVFVDVLPDSYNMNPGLIEEKISDKTKAILPVHLYGQVADMDSILAIADKHNLKVLEDSCQAHGAIYKGKRAGTMGHASAFSMYPGKNLGAFGEAGCVVTNSAEIADTVRCLREHGQSRKYYHKMEGFNGRMDNLQAAALRGKLPFLDTWNEKRRQAARLYADLLKDIPQVTLPSVADYAAHSFHLFVILVSESGELSEYLKEKEIYTGFHYPIPLHLQNSYEFRGEGSGSYPVSEKCSEMLLSLPMFPELTEAQVKKVCKEISSFFSNR